jgi:hypothetical protein
MSWKNHLVCLFTPTEGDRGFFGTAIPIGPGRLLTARHVVRPAKRGARRIHARWWYSKDPQRSGFMP